MAWMTRSVSSSVGVANDFEFDSPVVDADVEQRVIALVGPNRCGLSLCNDLANVTSADTMLAAGLREL